jgi:hypothetical protein
MYAGDAEEAEGSENQAPKLYGGNLYDLQKNLGHHSVAFTAEIYGHLSADHRIREATRVSYPEHPGDATVIPLGENSA